MMKNKMIRFLGALALLVLAQTTPALAQSIDSTDTKNSAPASANTDASLGMSPSNLGSLQMQLPQMSGGAAQQQAINPVPPPRMPPPMLNTAIQSSNVFGVNLFTGSFSRQRALQFNSDYLIAIGDQLQVRMWGGFNFDSVLVVDPQGNVFLPNVGPIKMLGVANKDIQGVMEKAVRRVYRANVYIYASLAAAQPVRIFVGGNVMRPGAYDGTSMDSLLHFLDLAGGIDPDRGSFLGIEVKRGSQLRARISLYDFLLRGKLQFLQLADGDMIFVPPQQNTVLVSGLAQNAKQFEFESAQLTMRDLIAMAKPAPQATNVRITRNTGPQKSVEYFALDQVAQITLMDGDQVNFTSDQKTMTISVRVQGEHDSPQEYVLPYGSSLGNLLDRIALNSRSDRASIQLFRLSVKDRQKAMLATSLRSLEAAVLTARSGSSGESQLRVDEANLALKWIDRAKQVEPLGQVVISNLPQPESLLLENGDIINIPTRDSLVLISGEVLFPNAVAFDPQLSVDDYINRAGGLTQQSDGSRIVIAHVDGQFEQLTLGGWHTAASIKPGDQVLVLPKVDEKKRQFWKDITQIIYQIAVSAKVVLGL
jgi:protein involved in polysaccharide export with SLBB domain